ncbi:MAG: hypothetical protein ACREAK_05710 [Nitrosarchaeum sp.]
MQIGSTAPFMRETLLCNSLSSVITVPEICSRIEDLHSMLKNRYPANEIAKRINDILIYADNIPQNLIRSAWELFAKKNGVNDK